MRSGQTQSSLCFFFQAEDGIRDRNVTGVQTCALPIYLPSEPVGPLPAAAAELAAVAIRADRAPGRLAGAPHPAAGTGADGLKQSRYPPKPQIGRASCRERVQISGGAVSCKKYGQGCCR